ncbi:MAG: ABC transporter permease, partial [Candidatus Dormibacteria bacterium]
MVPGNPIAAVIARAELNGQCNPACVQAAIAQLGIGHGSAISQYFQYWGNLFHGNLGISYFESSQPVSTLIAAYLPWTVGLLGCATVISFVLGTSIGILLGWRRGSRMDWVVPGATFFQAIPYFFLAMVIVEVFATGLKWFPPQYGYDITLTPRWSLGYIWSIIDHAVLPAGTVVLASAAGFILGMRNQMLTTMDEDFVLVARAKGLPSRRVVWYAARNAILPSVSNFSLAIS